MLHSSSRHLGSGSSPIQSSADRHNSNVEFDSVITMYHQHYTQDSIMPVLIYLAKWLPIFFTPASKVSGVNHPQDSPEAGKRHADMQMA